MSTLATQKSHREEEEEEEDMPDMQLSLNMHELDMENCKNKRKMNQKGYTSWNPTDSSNHEPCRL